MSAKEVKPTHVEFPIEPISKTGHIISLQQIEVTVDGPQQVSAKLKPGNNNKLLVYFTTTTTGKYTVHLKHKSEHLKLSPLVVNVTAKENENDESAPPSLPEIPKNNVRFEVDAYDRNGVLIPLSESFNVGVEGPEAVQAEVERNGDKIGIAFHTYISEGTFSVSVTYNGEHIQRSPFDIQITPDSDTHEHNEYELTNKNGEKVMTLPPLPKHREIQFSVPGRARDGSYITANEVTGAVILGEEAESPTRISNDPQNPQSLLVSFDAEKPGKHKISVTLKKTGQEIVNSPFSLSVPEEAFGRR